MQRALLLLGLFLVACGDPSPPPQDAGNQVDGPTADLRSEMPDLASARDQGGGSPDLGAPPDLASPTDLASAPDLSATPDLAAPPDLSVPPDLGAGGEDMASPPPRTTLRIHYPTGGRAITVRGSSGPLSWTGGQPATPGPDDTWTFTTTELTQAAEWKALIDDTTWSHGPNYHVAPGETVDVYPHFTRDRGQVSQLFQSFSSQRLNNTRTVWVYLPPTYLENSAARLPVIYMHDGQNLFDPALAFGGNEWKVDETINAAAEGGKCPDGRGCQNDGECGGSRCDTFREAIVVGPANTSQRIYEYTPTSDPDFTPSGGGDLYLEMLVTELKPQVDAMLRTRPEREHTGLMGSSLGGLISSYGGVRRPEVFGLIGAVSPSTWWDDRVILSEVASIPSAPLRALRVYVDSGDAGPASDGVLDTRDLAATYRSVGYVDGVNFRYLVGAGHQHNEIYWAQRLPGALTFLLGPRETITR